METWVLLISILMSSGDHGMSGVYPLKSEQECHDYAQWLFQGWEESKNNSQNQYNQLHIPHRIYYIEKHEGEWVVNYSCVEPQYPLYKPLLP